MQLTICSDCSDTHEIPPNGFPLNKALSKLVAIKANEVTRSDLETRLKAAINSMAEKAKQIELDVRIGETKIRNHCDLVRNRVQLTIEESHRKLDVYHEDFMAKIKDYETICLKQHANLAKDASGIDEILSQSNELCRKTNDLFKQYKIDESALQESLDQVTELHNSLEKTDDKLLCNMFNNKKMAFEPNEDDFESNIIGEIELKEIELYFSTNVQNTREVNFKSYLSEANQNKPNLVACLLSNEAIFIAYLNSNEFIDFLILDPNRKAFAREKERYCRQSESDRHES